jgi:integrase
LTAKFIDENVRRPTQGQKIIRDDDLKGFGLRVTKGSMSWIVEARVDGTLKRFTLGKYELMTPEQARSDCKKLLQRLATSNQATRIPTLEQVMARYLEVRTLSKNTLRNYNHLAERCLKDWYDLPMTSITKDMVLARHRELTRPTHQGTPGKIQANSAMSYLNSLFRFAIHHYESEDGQPLIVSNPVVTLSQNRVWHRTGVRRVIIPDHKLSNWYQAVLSLRQKMIRDYLLVLILTGLRKNEAAKLRWTDIDFDCKTLTIRAENTKNRNEYSLPMSEFLVSIMRRRKLDPRRSDFVFPGREGHLVDPCHCLIQVIEECGCDFVLHDLRRTFITTAAKLGIPHHLIKKLVNHISVADVTDGYVIFQVEHLRAPMAQITEHFLSLFGHDEKQWNESVEWYRPAFLQSKT